MHKAFEILKKQRRANSSPILADIEQYLNTGDKTLTKINRSAPWQYDFAFWSCENILASSLYFSDNMDDTNKRLLDVLVNMETWYGAFSNAMREENDDQNIFQILLESFRRCGKNDAETAMEFWNLGCFLNQSGKPNSGTRHYISMDDAEFLKLVAQFQYENSILNLTNYLLEYAPDRVAGLLDCLVLYKPDRYFPDSKIKNYTFMMNCAIAILIKTGDEHAERIRTVWETIGVYVKAASGIQLSKINPKRFLEPTKRAALSYLKILKEYPSWLLCFLMEHYGKEYFPQVIEFFGDREDGYYSGADKIFEAALKYFGADSLPIFDAVIDHPVFYVRFPAITAMVSAKLPEFDNAIEIRFQRELNQSAPRILDLLILARKWKPERLVESFWKLLGNKSKPVRETAARALGEIGEIDLDRVAKLLVDKKSDNRESAVNILAQQKTDAAIKLLEKRLDDEENDDIRDKMLGALESAWEAKGKKITMKTIRERMERAEAKLEKFAVQWLDWKKLPELRAEKKKLDDKTVRYLLYRQSRCKKMRADVEAKPLLAMVDRKTSGDFALFVLNAFLASKMDAADRWTLALAGLLGDDRIVPILSKQIQTWADSARGKMSEYTVQALSLLGTETALTVVNSMTIRYRTKYKNIGTAASNAFELVAERRGISADELGDRVVPMLGFESVRPKVWTIGGKDFEARIDLDFKVSIYDTEKKKTVSSLPKTTPKEISEELKEIKESLKEVVKGQLLRIENMLVRQYRWPVDRWTELYQRHPVLRPFTVRLVWGHYEENGKLDSTFRALEDGSLTDLEDETVKLPKTGNIGIVHPLELSEKERNAWRQHLLEFEITQPFPQLERSVIVPKPEEKTQNLSIKWNGVQLNAMTFKGRAEKLGWRRGSVCDAGFIPTYWKSFPEAGADAFLELENFYIGISMDEQVTLQDLYFVKSNSVQIGSYVYDDPDPNKGDPRIIPFGNVPPIVFSEVMGDMRKIAPDQKES